MKHRLLSSAVAAGGLLFAAGAAAAPAEKGVDYKIGKAEYHGTLYYDDAAARPLPLVLLVPNWLGTTPANLKQARDVAGRDYAVFVVDMYGKGQRPADQAAAGKAVAALYGDRAELRSRIVGGKREALAYLAKNPLPVDTGRIAAIGFCFGGATVVELARTGDPLAAVVSFHGNLSLDSPAPTGDAQPIRASILALHGDDDPYVPPKQVDAFLAEMRAAKADWELVRYSGAVHSFTDVDANTPGQAMYDAKVARRAFANMKDFLAERFAAVKTP